MKLRKPVYLCLFLGILLLPALAGGAADKRHETRSYNLNGFSAIETNSGIHLVLKQDSAFSIRVSGSIGALDKLDITVRGETLYLKFKALQWGWGEPVVVEVTMPNLTRLSLSGGSQADLIFDAQKSPEVQLDINGGSQLRGTLLATNCLWDLSGGSQIAIEGFAESLNGHFSGGSQLHATDFAVNTASLELSGGSWGQLAIQSDLKIHASGGSRLEYRGNPRIDQDVSGGSSIYSQK